MKISSFLISDHEKAGLIVREESAQLLRGVERSLGNWVSTISAELGFIPRTGSIYGIGFHSSYWVDLRNWVAFLVLDRSARKQHLQGSSKAGRTIHEERRGAEATKQMAGEVMKAVQYSGYGGGPASLKQVNVPVPIPKKGELLVKVEAVSVNALDWKVNEGLFRPFAPTKFPHTPGTDIAGEVVSVGASVTDFAPGDKVVSLLDFKNGGGFAEYAIALPKTTAKRPAEISAIDGASLPVAGLTALQTLRTAGVNFDGNYTGNVLITAAAGGVGLYAVQLAKLGGAHVTATVGARNIDLVKGLGVDEILDYKSEDGIKLISPSGKKYDIVINGASGIKWSTIQPQLSSSGQLFELQPNAGIFAQSLLQKITMSKQKRVGFMTSPTDKDLTLVMDLSAEGRLKTIVDSKYPLEKAGEAWIKSMEGHSTGKIVITVVDE